MNARRRERDVARRRRRRRRVLVVVVVVAVCAFSRPQRVASRQTLLAEAHGEAPVFVVSWERTRASCRGDARLAVGRRRVGRVGKKIRRAIVVAFFFVECAETRSFLPFRKRRLRRRLDRLAPDHRLGVRVPVVRVGHAAQTRVPGTHARGVAPLARARNHGDAVEIQVVVVLDGRRLPARTRLRGEPVARLVGRGVAATVAARDVHRAVPHGPPASVAVVSRRGDEKCKRSFPEFSAPGQTPAHHHDDER